MRRFALFLFAVSILVFAGCSGFKEVTVGNIKKLEVKGFENNKLALQIVIPINNPNPYRVKIKDSGIRVMNGGTELGKVSQMDKFAISGNTSRDYPVNVTLELTGLKNSNVFTLYRVLNNSTDLRISGVIKASYFLYTKAFKFDYPLSL